VRWRHLGREGEGGGRGRRQRRDGGIVVGRMGLVSLRLEWRVGRKKAIFSIYDWGEGRQMVKGEAREDKNRVWACVEEVSLYHIIY